MLTEVSSGGSHGDGHPDNTRTPLIVWGSGVARPVISATGQASGHEDGFSADWNLASVQRNDVNQADIAALMAYLVGLDFPVNSVGELPLSYLAASSKGKAEAMLVNAQGVLEMYHVKEEQKRASEIRYRAFPALGDEQHSVAHRVENIRIAISDGRHEEAIQMSKELLHLGLEGLRYLQTYDWLFLRALVTLGYLGWIAFAMTTVVDLHVLHGKTKTFRTPASNAAFGVTATAIFSLLVARKGPFTYYLYAIFPPLFWEEVFARREALASGLKTLFEDIRSPMDWRFFALQALGFLAILEALVSALTSSNWSVSIALLIDTQVLSYFHRTVYTVCFVLASVWPVIYGRDFVKRNKTLLATWFLSCQSMSIFTLFDAMKKEDTNLM